ncbi:MAG: replication-relaxation family protein [Microlunatus sp.]
MNRQRATSLAEQLSERDHALLLDLERFRLLSTKHLQRLRFTDHASELAAARASARALLRLEALGVVTALDRRIGGVRKGSASYIWQLTATGERYLRASRGEARRRRFLEPGAVFVNHTLAVNDVAVGLLEADRRHAGFTVEQLQTEPHNWRRYLGPAGEVKWLKPDLHVISVVGGQDGYEEHAFLEIDLGTEHLPRIQAKCRIYAAYARTGAYQAHYGLFPAVVWLSPDPARRAALSAAVAATTGLDGLPGGVFRVAGPEDYLRAATGVTSPN